MLFETRIAKSGVNNAKINELLFIQRPIIEKLIAGFDSHLDDLLPPNILQAALADVTINIIINKHAITGTVKSLANRIHRKYLVLTKLKPHRNGIRALPNLSVKQIERLLALRVFLKK